MPKQNIYKTSDLILSCEVLGFIITKHSSTTDIEVPAWLDFKQRLPKEGASEEVDTYHAIIRFLEESFGKEIVNQIRGSSGAFKVWSTGELELTLTFSKGKRLITSKKDLDRKQKRTAEKLPKNEDAMYRRVQGHYGSNQ